MKHMECHIGDLIQGQRYYFRVACGNLKGYGKFRQSTPKSVIPSRRLQLLEDLFSEIRSSRPEHAAEIKATVQAGELLEFKDEIKERKLLLNNSLLWHQNYRKI
ncbi:Ankyrin repeat and fibronectin type-III domain-containing protein 1 [Gryllus bimaculatus]|nr:Ankyrin repeat and fibronectin type-III domain-containing protein 1 [Gryllus bimaculatus]